MNHQFKKIFMTATGVVMSLTAFSQVSFGDAAKFNTDWSFALEDSTYFKDVDYNEARWRHLDLPHDWSIEGQLSPSLASCTGYLPGGIAWYRKHFKITDNKAKHYIYFEGVYNRSEVYVNGQLLGKRPNGFASFMYDLTPYLKDGDNVIAVRVDHSRYADSRWYTGSGIYRDVWLISAPETHFAQWGVGYEATKINKNSATIKVDFAVENLVKGLKASVSILDAYGKKVASTVTSVSKEKTYVNLNINNLQRWDIKNPYLYKMNVELLQNGEVIDCTSMNVGIRSLKFDANKGFSLNDKNIKVKGVCLHHDAGTLGAVVPPEVWKRRLLNLKNIGVNAIRMSHNPQAPVLYDLCDQLGFLVMDEASDEWEFPKRKWVQGWNTGTPSYDGSYDFFEEWIDRDVTDMVRRDRSHPSIFLWSIGNEVDYPNDPYSHPVLDGSSINQPMYGGYKEDAPRAERIGTIAKRLVAQVKAVDTSRPCTGALAGVVMSNQTEYPEAVDVVGYNYTENRYDEDHSTYPTRIIYGSENGVHYSAWRDVVTRDFIFGQFIWTGIDYLGESGRWPSRGLYTGLLDLAAFNKPRGNFRASLWCENPVSYVGTYPARPARDGRGGKQDLWVDAAWDTWNYDEGQNINVLGFSNAPHARLLLNGEVVGEKLDYDIETGIYHWVIPYTAGSLTIEGLNDKGNVESTYTINTTGRPYAIKAYLEGDKSSEEGATLQLVINVVDENGYRVNLADNEITCFVSHNARLLGLEGGNNSDMTDYTDNHQRVFHGQLLAYIKRLKADEPIKVRLSSPLLKSLEIEL